ncbi:MAG TPA: hypothetical protein VKU62_12960, partial [Thermoanaerobaculia bacterium]|nr:hypothetical protein [Thermoanaerobaculia bacterium]
AQMQQLLTGGFIVPVAGMAAGVGGTRFTTNITFSKGAQAITVLWLPSEPAAAPMMFRVTLPASSDPIPLRDFVERLGVKGFGSLVIDANALAEIWSHPNDGRAPFSQSIQSAPSSPDHDREVATGRHDTSYRTNIGIVNLSTEWHEFTVQLNGERANGQISIAVAPLSMIQAPAPDGDYGNLSVVTTADTAARWLSYASTINNTTGEARTSIGNAKD